MWMALGAAACLLLLFFLIVMLRDSNRFVTVHYRLRAPRLKKKVRIALLADLHNKRYGEGNKKLLEAVDRQKPDLILCAGDLITSVPGHSMENAKALVRALAAKYPFYYGNGNHEYRIYRQPETFGKMGAAYRAFLKGCHVRLLENSSTELPEYGIRLYGLDLPEQYYGRFKKTTFDARTLSRMVGRPHADCYNILLAHNPAHFEGYASWGADLTLSGHVHGGIVRLPWLGGVISTSLTLFPKYDGGMFEREGRRMIISRGLGSHTIPVRLFNPAELVIIDLVPESEE
ncbi:MAG: metallophosphoesterase [Eubacteriales bacterium]|nr:metallophosphoesterase [Eubacteriales bacterium]